MIRFKQIMTLRTVAKMAVVMLFLSSLLVRCANTTTPQGGPRDTIPPVLMVATPENFSTKFAAKRIFVEFNEYVQLKDQHKEFFTSPRMKSKPTLSIRGRGVMIDIKDTLRDDQTYVLNFGAALRDNNEGNPLHSFSYVFSTGEEIDSMWMSGYTADAQKSDSVGKSYIYFYRADSLAADTAVRTAEFDSTLLRREPDAIARAETNGIFLAQHLKPIDYRIYAFQDKNDNQMYDPGTDLVGFVDSTYNPLEMQEFAIWYDSLRRYWTGEPQIYMRMFMDGTFKRQMLTSAERPKSNQAILRFGAPRPQIDSIIFDSIASERVIWEFQTEGRDTMSLWLNVPPEELPDTIKGRIVYMKHDTTNTLNISTEPLTLAWRKIETKEEERAREREERERKKAEEAGEEYTPPPVKNPFSYRITTSGDINPERGLEFEFEYPLVKLDTAMISLAEIDDKQQTRNVPIELTRDTTNMRRWRLMTKWGDGLKYKLTIPDSIFVDVAGYANDSITKELTTMAAEKYAKVIIDLRGRSDSSTYILQLLGSDGKKVIDEIRDARTGKHTFSYVAEGEHRVRIVEDANGNGRWDSGNLIEGRQPERVEVYRNERDEEVISTKMNWDVEIVADMNRMFAPVTMQSLIRQLDARESVRLVKYYEEVRKKREEEKRRKEEGTHNHSGGNPFGGFGSNFNF